MYHQTALTAVAEVDAAHRADVEQVALQRLSKGTTYAHYFRAVSIEFQDGVLILRGRVPTFYMKQLLQTMLRNLDGVTEIDNGVHVVDQASALPLPA